MNSLYQSVEKSFSGKGANSALLSDGARFLRLKRPCGAGDGIVQLDQSAQERFACKFDIHAVQGRASKFVAASGAASRMFKTQISYRERRRLTRHQLVEEFEKGNAGAVELLRFVDHLPEFPFAARLRGELSSRGLDLGTLLANGEYSPILSCLLDPDGLGYATAPKGLVTFHSYPSGPRTAFEEHLVEAAGYLRDRNGKIRVHFTVPPEEELRILRHLRGAAARFAEPGTEFRISLSTQEKSAIALKRDGSLFRNEDGTPVLWPSGHGALLRNLGDFKGDIVFIRTIDNVLPDSLKSIARFHKRVLGGMLVETQERCFEILEALESDSLDLKELSEVEEWCSSTFHLDHPCQSRTRRRRMRALSRLLNRPLRVCGMVRNMGEPGGAPFWVEGPDGQEILQIVEPAEVNIASEPQRKIWNSATFFNPVDIVCGLRDRRGFRFDLIKYSDPGAGFVSVKWRRNEELQILEKPGLWNGSMAFWNTIFVEVPRSTLHPVKNVLDLLSPLKQPASFQERLQVT